MLERKVLSAHKIKNSIYSALKLHLLILLIFVGQAPAQTNELSYILINGNLLENTEESDWLEDSSTILIQNINSETTVELIIIPDSGFIEIIPNTDFPVSVYINEELHGSLLVQFPNNIDRFKLGIRGENGSEDKYIYLSAKLGSKIEYSKYDILVFPLVYKYSKKIFNLFSKPEAVLRIHKSG